MMVKVVSCVEFFIPGKGLDLKFSAMDLPEAISAGATVNCVEFSAKYDAGIYNPHLDLQQDARHAVFANVPPVHAGINRILSPR